MSGVEGPVQSAAPAIDAVGRARHMTVLTHRRVADTEVALRRLLAAAAQMGVTLHFDAEETDKHGLQATTPGIALEEQSPTDVELCLVLGGDGTILRALQRYAGTGVPVFAVNFGEIGFLATIEPEELDDGIRRALSGDFELHASAGDRTGDSRGRGQGDQRRGHPSQGG